MLFVIWRLLAPSLQRDQAKSSTGEDKEVDPYHSLEPLQDFDWSSTEPIKIRPFKPKYHLTMGKFSFKKTEHHFTNRRQR